MVSLADTLWDILGAPAAKTASLGAAVRGAQRTYAVDKAVERAISDPEKAPSKASVRRDLTKTLEEAKTASLSNKQKRYAGYMGAGMVGLPLLAMATSKVRGMGALGGQTLKKWLPEQAVQGAFWGGMPAVAEEIAAKYPSKTASGAGQDLRTPFTGGTKFPTDDSKTFAKDNLAESKNKAEVGPAPLMSKLKPKGPSVQDVTPKVSNSTAGFLPKIGYAMHNDPLIQYLQHQEAEKQAMVMEDNEDNEPRDKHWPDEMTTQDPSESEFAEDKGPSDLQSYLSEKFDTSKGHRPKYLNKDHKAVAGMVNKVLKK